MLKLKTVPLFGADIANRSFVVTRQRRLNVYFEVRDDHDKTSIAVYGTPALVPYLKTNQTGKVQGMLGTPSALYIVTDGRFQSVKSDGSEIAGGTISNATDYVSLASNPDQVVVADGVKGYLYTVATKTFVPIAVAFPNGAKTVTFVSSFFVAEEPGTQRFWVSNANDGSTWNALAFSSASAYPGSILAVDSLSGNLLIFCTDHVEFWQNVGAAPEPFAPIQAATREYGIAALLSRDHVGESLIFLAANSEGLAQVAQISNYDLKIISHPDLDAIINSFDTVSDAVSLSYGVDSHKFYQITFPSANRSFLFDLKTRLWSETQTGLSIIPTRHWGDLSTVYAGKTIISDYATNQIYIMSSNVFLDAVNQVIPREIITKHVLSNFNRIRISQLYLDMEVGVGLNSGQGSDPQIMLQYSKDNGHTWGSERWRPIGKLGKYKVRVAWRRFGSTLDAVFRIRVTDPIQFVISDAAMTVREKGKQRPQ